MQRRALRASVPSKRFVSAPVPWKMQSAGFHSNQTQQQLISPINTPSTRQG